MKTLILKDSTYPDSLHKHKREIQKKIFPLITQKVVYCLGGPNINEYVKLYPKTVKKIVSYENNKKIFDQQKETLSDTRVELKFGNIFEAPVRKGGFYDIDLMGTADSAGEIIKRFKDCAFVLTLMNARCKSQREKIFMFLEETVIKDYLTTYNLQKNNIKKCRFITNKNRYYFDTYHDTCAMLMLFKIPKKFY